MAKLAYPFIRGLQGTLAILDCEHLTATGNINTTNTGTIKTNTTYVFKNGVVGMYGMGPTIFTDCNFTRLNGDVWEFKNDGFYMGSTKIIDTTGVISDFVLFIIKQSGRYYLAKSDVLGVGTTLSNWNGHNRDNDSFTSDLAGWSRAIKYNVNTGDHDMYLRCNNSSGPNANWSFLGTGGIAYNTVIELHFSGDELYEYSPTGYPSNNEPLGGDTGSNDPSGDSIEMPDAPDETVSGTLLNGFLNIYSPSDTQLKNFGGALWTNAFNTKWYDVDSLANLVLNTISDPINFIIGLFMLPIAPTTGSSSGIYLGGINVNTVTAPRITNQFKKVSFGSIAIDELYGNYLDYSNSRLSIYMPYIGTADLDIQEVNGGTVELQYTIDCFTGACVANVRCVKQTKTPWGMTYQNETVHSYSGNVAVQLPISAGSFDTMTQGLINIGLGLGSNSPSMIINGATSALTNIGGDATTRGSLSSNTGRLCYQTPYLMFTRPIESRPASLGHVHGYSAGAGGTLSSFNGYVECSDVNLSGVTATDTELDMIKSLLSEGVYV